MSARYSKAEAAGQRCMMFAAMLPKTPASALAFNQALASDIAKAESYDRLALAVKAAATAEALAGAVASKVKLPVADLVAAVRVHAHANYESGGWDILVECWDDFMICEAMGSCKTVKGAIAKIGKRLALLAERRADVVSQ